MAILKCKMCGGDIAVNADQTYGTCDSCGCATTLPKATDGTKANLYNRANHFRRQNDFDKARMAYEQILDTDNTEAEAYWGVVLSKYGIEYVDDPKTHKPVPTCHRVQLDSILNDADYLAALEYAPDAYTRSLYESEARQISAIQKNILEISSKEKPYDVFICYKEKSEAGTRTKDSAIAQDIYYQLAGAGMRVFFSRISLENKLGQAYEPYIFAAIKSAKVMLVVGAKPEHFNAVWVKNEWSRYLALMKTDKNKTLIPCYRDMDPYDLPEALSMLQSLDMSKIGFMQDLIRGIQKILGKDGKEHAQAVNQIVEPVNKDALLKRGHIFLSDGNFQMAAQYFDKVLDMEPELADAYVGRLCAELRVHSKEHLSAGVVPLTQFSSYNNAVRFADDEQKKELENYHQNILNKLQQLQKEKTYKSAMELKNGIRNARQYYDAAAMFRSVAGYKDAEQQAAECDRLSAEAEAMEQQTRIAEEHHKEQARIALEAKKKKLKKTGIIGIPIISIIVFFVVIMVNIILPAGYYNNGIAALKNSDYETASLFFQKAGTHSDAPDKLREASYAQAINTEDENPFLAAVYYRQAVPYQDSLLRYTETARKLSGKISAGLDFIVGLNADGSAVAAGTDAEGQTEVGAWTNLTQISAGEYYTAGLMADGSVVVTGKTTYGKLDVGDWRNIIAIATGDDHMVGLRADGSVISTGSNWMRKGNIAEWKDMIAIAAGNDHTIGLKNDGTVEALGFNLSGKAAVEGWAHIVAIAGGDEHTIGLTENGAVVATGSNKKKQCNTSAWANIVSIAAGRHHSVGLKTDGTVVAVGENAQGQCDVSGWTEIIAIAAGDNSTVGLRADGTVVIAGNNGNQAIETEGWQLLQAN